MSSTARLTELLERFDQSATGSVEQDLAALQAALAPLPPGVLDAETISQIEEVVRDTRDREAIIDASTLPTVDRLGARSHRHVDKLSIWVGDITNLAADAVVNAANSSLLGCRLPYHFCIDYALHAGAGPRLRSDCDALVQAQGRSEPVGTAKITPGHALPARQVIHTVGPQLTPGAEPTPAEAAQLESCYRACLDVAADGGSVDTIAFCAISTGVFAYPKALAADLAIATVDDWLTANPGVISQVIFNLFSEADADHYRRALGVTD